MIPEQQKQQQQQLQQAPPKRHRPTRRQQHKKQVAIRSKLMIEQENSNDPRRPRQPQRRRQKQQQQQTRKGGRLWQLPDSSIQGYAKWIEEKPVEEQSVAEQKFLWKYQRRVWLRQNKLPTETLKDFVARLEAKEERNPVENRLIHQFRSRQGKRKQKQQCEKGSVPPPIFWKRDNSKAQAQQPTPTPSSTSTSSSSGILNMASLRESMDKLGLSSDKLREINMEKDASL
jgi:hypothetical protein